MSIGGEELLTLIESENPRLGQYLRRYVTPAIETTARNAGVSATGKVQPPQPPESLSVATAGELLEVKVNHAAPVQKGIQYITHISANDPIFQNPTIIDHYGTSRCPPLYRLPAKDAGGVAITYHVRTAAQMPGGDPSPWTYGGAVTLTGTTQMTLQPGTGSGTGAANGQQSAVGLGVDIFRPAPAAKRTVNGS
jgi:hypothetical protein